MYAKHTPKKYLANQIESASPGMLTLMLFDGAIRYLNTSKDKVSRSLFSEAFSYKINAQDIIYELSASLNMEHGSLPQNLYRLYDYMMDKLISIEINEKYPAEIDEVINVLAELRTAWKEMLETSLSEQGMQTGDQKNDPPTTSIPRYA
jgi:flagellar protein FliS